MKHNQDYTFVVRVNNKDTTEYRYKGKTYIEGRKGSEYELYFFNNTPTRILAVFSVDGLSVLDGKVASDKSRGYVVDPFRSLTVPGWTIDNSKVATFQFRPQGEKDDVTYVEALKEEGFDVDVGNQGVIGCMVFKEKVRYYVPPKVVHHYHTVYAQPAIYPPFYGYLNNSNHYADSARSYLIADSASPVVTMNGVGTAMSLSAGYATAQAKAAQFSTTETLCASSNNVLPAGFFSNSFLENSLGTGFGDDKEFETETVSFERDEKPIWIGVVNYDTITNLRRMGIPIDSWKPEKQAFPGYSGSGCYVPKRR